ncbi:MAG TPA: ABC transporter substrate-binding protein [Burkholderiales bacterium]|nr:ABC transporter substrate-binding protein [Burkholderiales bacterium]
MQRTRRREFLFTAAALAAAPLARAQARRTFRIGFGYALLPEREALFRQLLAELGRTHGSDYVFVDSGLAFGADLDEAARRVVAREPDVIYVTDTAFALAVQKVTRTIPVVMYSSGYPVAAGVAQSLARPGGNVTGNTAYAGTGIWGKLFQLLAEAKPGVKRVGLVWDYLPPIFAPAEIEFGMGELRAGAGSLGLALEFAEIRNQDEVPDALARLVAQRVDALLVTYGPVLRPEVSRVLRFAVAKRLPTIMDSHPITPHDPGPLLVYSASVADLTRRSFAYIDRILRGEKAGDLPIQQPARFELVVNLRTATAIGLVLPQSILARADKVIE